MIRLPFDIPFWRRRRGEEKREDGDGRTSGEKLPVVVRGESEKAVSPISYKQVPKIIFVGSGKGGVGKSFVSSNLLYVLSAHVKTKMVFGVDLDLDNTTLSMIVPPTDVYNVITKKWSTNIKYLNVASVLDEGIITSKAVLKIPIKMFTCGGSQISTTIRLIPAYSEPDKKRQMIKLKDLDVLRLREGLTNLIEYIRDKNGVAVLDGKQKSNLGINYDPLYKLAKEEADVVLLVTEPPYLSFSTITAQYRDILHKLIIVVNKFDMGFAQQLSILLSDANRYQVPVFIVPYSKEDGEDYSKKLTPPAVRLSSRSAKYIGALAHYLGLVETCDTGCCKDYNKILTKNVELMSMVG